MKFRWSSRLSLVYVVSNAEAALPKYPGMNNDWETLTMQDIFTLLAVICGMRWKSGVVAVDRCGCVGDPCLTRSTLVDLSIFILLRSCVVLFSATARQLWKCLPIMK